MDLFQKLAINQMDQKLDIMKESLRPFYYIKNWISLVRKTLGMSTYTLSRRMGVSQPTISSFEKRESEGHVTLETMEKIATAMECDFVYGFVPKSSLLSFIQAQENKLADSLLNQVHHTMRLENQSLTSEAFKQQKELFLETVRNKPLSYLWKHDAL